MAQWFALPTVFFRALLEPFHCTRRTLQASYDTVVEAANNLEGGGLAMLHAVLLARHSKILSGKNSLHLKMS